MSGPKVTVAIPVYNGSDYLAQAIDSALGQTYENLEVLVVNDGSTDNGRTAQVVRTYAGRIRYVEKPNGGVASALNRAVEEMHGDYFSWLSHDDLYTEDKVAREMAALQQCGREDAVIYSDYAVFTLNPDEATPVRLKHVAPEHFRYWITVENRLHGCTLLVPRSAFEKVGLFNESLRTTQDYDLWFRMADRLAFIHLPEVLVKARSHPGQDSRRLAGVALAECDALLSGFVRELRDGEIEAGTGMPLADAYRLIGQNMRGRGFVRAGDLAEELAIRHGAPAVVKPSLTEQAVKHLGQKGMNIARRYLPHTVKQRIKAAIRPVAGLLAGGGRDRPEDLGSKFSEIYEKNIFGGRISRSGEGSDLVQTEAIRRALPGIVRQYSVHTFLDAPCGDWFWMRHTDLGVDRYIGVDIVDTMIEQHRRNFGDPSTEFHCLNLVEDPLPKADLIFSRDCLVHLSFRDALKIIANFKRSGARYLLTTTFVERKKNNDLVGVDAFWRPLNMCLEPFNFPEPLLVVNEGCTEEAHQYTDKALGLWLLEDIPV